MKNDGSAGFKTLCVPEYCELTLAFGFSLVRPGQFCLARFEQRQDHEIVGAMLFAADKYFMTGSAKPLEMFWSRVTRVQTTPTVGFWDVIVEIELPNDQQDMGLSVQIKSKSLLFAREK